MTTKRFDGFMLNFGQVSPIFPEFGRISDLGVGAIAITLAKLALFRRRIRAFRPQVWPNSGRNPHMAGEVCRFSDIRQFSNMFEEYRDDTQAQFVHAPPRGAKVQQLRPGGEPPTHLRYCPRAVSKPGQFARNRPNVGRQRLRFA